MSLGAALAIDHGTVKTGFAVCDALRISVQPLTTVRADGHGDELLGYIADLMAEREIRTFVLGLPLNMDGSEGPRAADVRRFAERLCARFPNVELAWIDERLTTVEADERLRKAGYHWKQAKPLRDSWSAVVLLEDWLTSLSG